VPSAAVNGIDLYYERSGEGPRLLFLNGSGATLESAGMLLQLFADGFDVAAHDQRGLGRTSIPVGPFTMADYAADAAGLLDELGWDSCRVLGVSFGGMVAQELAATHPERIERLALVCTSSGGAGSASYPLHELASLAPSERIAIATRLLDTRFSPEWLSEHANDRALAEMMAARGDVAKSDEQVRGEAEQLEARRHHDVWDRLPNISSPTFVASGRYDGIAPPANGEAIASRIPDAKLQIYEGGHAFFVQDPDAIPDITGFLKA
jgi:3-oxoadipate enol-lactonase